MRYLRQFLTFTVLGFVGAVAVFGASFIAGLLFRIATIAFNYGHSIIS